jgi:hypothetical protein
MLRRMKFPNNQYRCDRRPRRRLRVGWLGSSCVALTLAAGCVEMDGASDVVQVQASTGGVSAAPGVTTDGACPVPGTLAHHVAQAANGGRFDYDPAGALVKRVKGRYRARSGRFRWRERFQADSFVHQRVVRGQAESFGAQQSLAYEVETTDVLDNVSVAEVEETWDGCEVARRFRPAGGTEQDWRSHHGSYDGVTYTYLEEQAPHAPVNGLPIITVSGTVFPDQSWIEEFEGGGSPEYYQTRTGDGSGNVSLTWAKDYGDAVYRGAVETAVDGSQQHSNDWFTDGDGCTSGWRAWTVGPDGHGAGASQLCDFSSDEYGLPMACTLSITPGQCVESCANGAIAVRPSCL